MRSKKRIKKSYLRIILSVILLVAILIISLYLALQKRSQTPLLNAQQEEIRYTGGVIVKFKKSVTKPARNKFISEKLKRKVRTEDIGSGLMVLDSGNDNPVNLAVDIASNPEVSYAEPDFYGRLDEYPNDTYFSKQWYLQEIKVPTVWYFTRGAGSVRVAVIDSGIAEEHPDISSKVVERKVASSISVDGDSFGHGTHVAGIIAAEVDNNRGIAGIAPNVSLVSIKITSSGQFPISDACWGITKAVEMGVDIINMSFGVDKHSICLEEAVNLADSKGIILVASAGNKGRNEPPFPAAFNNVISVGGIDKEGKILKFSNRGKWVEFVAPGNDIYSTNVPNIKMIPGADSREILVNSFLFGVKNIYAAGGKVNLEYYRSWRGTSFSAPQITGVAALVKSYNPDMSGEDIIKRMCDTAEKIEGTGDLFTCGKINALRAVLNF